MMFLESSGQAGSRPSHVRFCLNGHNAVRDVRQAIRRSEALKFLELNSFNQASAGTPIFGMIGEMVDERVGVYEDRLASLEIVEDHGDSMMPNSGSRAKRSRVSTSPVQGTMPAVCLAKLVAY